MSMLKIQIFILIFSASVKSFAWSAKEVQLAQKIMKGDQNSLDVLDDLERQLAKPSIINKALLETAYLADPPKKDIETPNLDALLTTVTGIDVKSLSEVTLPGNLNSEQQQVVYTRINNLLSNPEITNDSEKMELLSDYLKSYFEFDVSLTDEQIAATDPSLKELNSVMDNINKSAEYTVSEIKDFVAKKQKESVDNLKQVVNGAKEKINNKLDQVQSGVIEAIDKSSSQTLEIAKETYNEVSYLADRTRQQEFQEELLKMSNYEKIDDLIEQSKTCVSTTPKDRCALLKSEKNQKLMKDLREANYQKDVHDTVVGSLGMIESMANVFGDKDLAEDISKAKFAVDTTYKIVETINKMDAQSMIGMAASMTNVVSMAFTVAGLFGGGGGDGDALQQISMQIQELRKEMHERFDLIEAQLTEIGIGLNLKLDNTNGNIIVVLKNQEQIFELQNKTLLAIANLTTVQSNQNITDIFKDLRQKSSLVLKNNDPEYIREPLSEAVSSYWNHITYVDSLRLQWQKQQTFALNSEELINVLAQVNTGLPQENFAIYSLMDYLINTNLIDGTLRGACSRVNFNDVYLFNILSVAVLPIFRASYGATEIEFAKNNKYLDYLYSNNLNPSENIRLLVEPLEKIDLIVHETDRCLNSYANIDNKSQNLLTYLISNYKKLVVDELNKVINNTSLNKHMQDLLLAIQDPNQGYFSDKKYDKSFIAIDSDRIELRQSITLKNVDIKKSYEDNLILASDKFYEENKVVSYCDNLKEDKYPEYQKILLNRTFFDQVFSSNKMKLASMMGLNLMPKLCYRFGSGHLNGTHKSYTSVALLKFDLRFTKEVSYEIPIFLPVDQLVWTDFLANNENEILDYREPDVESGFPTTQPPVYMEWTESSVDHKSVLDYLYNKFSAAEFECFVLNSAFNTCWVKGYKPKYSSDFNLQTVRYLGLPMPHKYLPLYSSLPEYKAIENGLKAEFLENIFTEMQIDLQNCIRKTLLGASVCRFKDYYSADAIANKIKLDPANRVNSIIRMITPLIVGFKANVSSETRRDFFIKLDEALISIEELLIQMALEKDSPLEKLLSEIDVMVENLENIEKLSETLIELNSEKFIATEPYQAIKYYSELTEEVFKNKKSN